VRVHCIQHFDGGACEPFSSPTSGPLNSFACVVGCRNLISQCMGGMTRETEIGSQAISSIVLIPSTWRYASGMKGVDNRSYRLELGGSHV
jgi:hypothetical protein